MSTPIQPTQQQQQPTVGAPGLNAFAGCGQPEQPAACGGRPLGLYLENLPQPAQPGMDPTTLRPQGLTAAPTHMSPAPQVPGMPESFNAPGCQAASSPFDEDAGPRIPNVPPSRPYGHQPGQYAQGGNFNIYDQRLPYNSVQRLPALWEPSYKENRDLHTSDATISSYTKWAQSTFDHLSRTNRGWPQHQIN